ncbi:MAG: hypothetical protein ACXWEA_08000, partial [Solirubrobacterales bacterium]
MSEQHKLRPEDEDPAFASIQEAIREGDDPGGPGEAAVIDADALEPEQEVLTINMGPHHPATHGVLRLVVTLQGENVLDIKPVVGYVHTGIEKSCEAHPYWKVIP